MILKANNLSISYQDKEVIDNLSLTVNSGEIIGVVGNNGAGKSTLLKGLSGELKLNSGDVLLFDKPIDDIAPKERAKYLAFLPQVSDFLFDFSVMEMVQLGRLPHHTNHHTDIKIIEESLKLTDAWHLKNRDYLSLSGGEKQRVHLARVIAQLYPISKKSLFFLDEPTNMLDPLHQQTVLKVMEKCKDEGASVLLTLHDFNLAAEYCTQIIMLYEHKIYAKGSPKEVLTKENIEAIFGLKVIVSQHPTKGYPLIIRE